MSPLDDRLSESKNTVFYTLFYPLLEIELRYVVMMQFSLLLFLLLLYISSRFQTSIILNTHNLLRFRPRLLAS